MTVTREDVARAVWALKDGLQFDVSDNATPEMKTWMVAERKLRLFSDVGPEEQPYIAQVEHAEDVVKGRNLPYRWSLSFQWFIYHSNHKIPAIVNNNILDAIQAALKPTVVDPGYFENRNTLLGKVYACYIEGEIFKDPGDIDNQAMMVVPIKVLVP